MKKIVEGNPALVEEHPVELDHGAYVYHYGTDHPRVEIVMNNFFHIVDGQLAVSDGWAKVGAALIEARRMNQTPRSMEHPSELVGWARRWFRENEFLYDVLEKNEDQVRLIIRTGRAYQLDKVVDPRGITKYTPALRWTVEVITAEGNAYPKPVQEG